MPDGQDIQKDECHGVLVTVCPGAGRIGGV